MDRTQIMTILPHRNSMLLLDEVEKEGDESHGILMRWKRKEMSLTACTG